MGGVRLASERLWAASWLVFAFVVGAAYRGNLTASLTVPKYPPRVETLRELVASGARVTMPPYGAQFRDFFRESESSAFRRLGERVGIVATSVQGLEEAVAGSQAHMEARRFLQLQIAERFTPPEGGSRLYVGREGVFPGLSAWPLPHDAPYKGRLDRCIMAVKEGGLYEKWSRDLLSEARRESREKRKRRRERENNEGREPEAESNMADGRALTTVHLQGPLLLLLLGLAAGLASFALEGTAFRCFGK